MTLSQIITFKLESVLYQDAGLEKEHSLRLLEHLSVVLGEQQAGSRAQQAHLLCGGGCGDVPGAVSGAGTRLGSRCSCSSWGPAPLQQVQPGNCRGERMPGVSLGSTVCPLGITASRSEEPSQ